jgi:polar amino acid transport system permease protein
MHDFLIVWSERSLLLWGLLNTVALSVLGGLCALALGVLLAMAMMPDSRPTARVVRALVDLARCTPFLLFAYVVYFGLPSVGIRFDNWEAGLGALSIYHAAYVAEIVRGAWVAQPQEPIEAARACGYFGFRLLRHIVFPPLALASAPVLGNQLVQIIKDSAFLTVIAIPELTNAASSIQSRRYVPFASFIVAMLLYWALCLIVEAAVSAAGRIAEVRR